MRQLRFACVRRCMAGLMRAYLRPDLVQLPQQHVNDHLVRDQRCHGGASGQAERCGAHMSDARLAATRVAMSVRTAGAHVVGGLAPELGAVVNVQPEQVARGDVLHAKVAHNPLRHRALARALQGSTAR